MRLLWVYHVFRVFRKTSRLWSDQFLFLGVMLICSGEVFILCLWTAIDIFHLEASEVYVRNAQLPYYSGSATCLSINLGVWLALAFLYTPGCLSCLWPIQTKHIKLQHFKETKKFHLYHSHCLGNCSSCAVCILHNSAHYDYCIFVSWSTLPNFNVCKEK